MRDEAQVMIGRLKEACNGHPHAKIPWPHRLLHDAIDLIEKLDAKISRQSVNPGG